MKSQFYNEKERIKVLKELHSFEEINDYFAQANNYTKSRIYGMAYRYGEILEKENKIRDKYKDDRFYRIEEIFIINDYYQIVKIIRKDNQETLYEIFVDYESIHQITERFDTALISAIAYKYTRSTTAAMYFGKMIDMELR